MSNNATTWTRWQRAVYDLRVWHYRHRYAINLTLLALLIVVLVAARMPPSTKKLLFAFGLHPRLAMDALLVRLTTASAIVSLLRDTLSVVAVIVAGAWVYYQFIRGRTFSPKLDLEVEYVGLCGQHKDFALLRLIAKNEGRTRVEPITVLAKCFYGVGAGSRIAYGPLCESQGLLEEFFHEPETARVYLEPQDSLKIDYEVPLGSIPPQDNNLQHDGHCIVKVRFYVQDRNRYTWQRIKVLIIDQPRGT